KCGLQAHRNHRDNDCHDEGFDEEFDDERPSRYPFTAARREIKMNRPTGEGETHSVEAATDVVYKCGLARIVSKVAVHAACEQSYSGQNDRRCQRPPHVASTSLAQGGAVQQL